MDARAAELIARLALEPHPEGGYFREVYRSAAQAVPADGRPPRAVLTTIYFLLPAGAHSRWHRVASDEAWHFYEGDPIELFVAYEAEDAVERVVLGPPFETDGPTFTVPAGRWQAARPMGRYALVGCTVAPGFEFEDFELLRDNPDALERLADIDALWRRLA